METGAKPAAQKAAEVLNEAVRNRLAQAQARTAAPAQQQAAAEATPTGNAFYKVMFDESLDPEAKKDAIAKLLTFPGTKEESRARIKEYAAFSEWAQAVRERMAVEIIRLQDTETFSILQNVMNNLNAELLDFEKQMQPLTDITDAIYTLRTNDATLDVFAEIQNDKEREAKEKAAEEERNKRFEDLRANVSELENANARLGEEKGFFGLGGVTKDARQKMAINNLELDRSKAELVRLQGELAALEKTQTDAPGQYANEKAKLRELLDLTSDKHKERQKALVDSALRFVESAKRDIGEVKVHLEKMNSQVENLLDNNTKMTGVYAVLSEGIEDAQKQNHAVRDGVMTAPEGERSIAKMQREDKKMVLDDHIRLLDDAVRTTTAASADLTSQTIRVKGMKDANESTLQTTRVLHTQGVAGIADRLSSTLQAVASAALGESSAAAKDTLRKMAELTDRISQRESVRVAMGIKETNRDLVAALDSLSVYGEVQRAANEITRAGLADIRANLDKIREATTATQKDLHDSFAAAADTVGGAPTAPAEQKDKGPDPFKFGGN